MALMTSIFDAEPQVSVAALDCQRYKELCRTIGVPDPPSTTRPIPISHTSRTEPGTIGRART
jgi:hypothetical protein